jgi:hypothetical protein
LLEYFLLVCNVEELLNFGVRASHTRQINGYVAQKEGYHGPSGWRSGGVLWKVVNLPRKKKQFNISTLGARAGRKRPNLT